MASLKMLVEKYESGSENPVKIENIGAESLLIPVLDALDYTIAFRRTEMVLRR